MATCDPWTEKEMIRILESKALKKGNAKRNRCLFAMQCATGGRISELLSLRRRDVVDKLGRIPERISFTNTKNGETRHVDLVNPFPIPFIKKWLSAQEDQGYFRADTFLFTKTTGEVLSRFTWWKLIKEACLELRLKGHYGTHSARKTWARDTYAYWHKRAMKGEVVSPIVKLKDAGGWKTFEATQRYVAFMLGDNTASQHALFPELKKRYAS